MAIDQQRTFVNQRVVPYKKLRAIHIIDHIPISAAGKVLRRELRDTAQRRTPISGTEPDDGSRAVRPP